MKKGKEKGKGKGCKSGHINFELLPPSSIASTNGWNPKEGGGGGEKNYKDHDNLRSLFQSVVTARILGLHGLQNTIKKKMKRKKMDGPSTTRDIKAHL